MGNSIVNFFQLVLKVPFEFFPDFVKEWVGFAQVFL